MNSPNNRKTRKSREEKSIVHRDQYFAEITKKEQHLLLNSLRLHALTSDNAVLRAMNEDRPVTHLHRPSTTSASQSRIIDLTDDAGGEHVLSRGSLPSVVPARYDALPHNDDWNTAEKRYMELQQELQSLDKTMIQRKQEVHREHFLVGNAGNIMTVRPSTTSTVGSAFKWRDEGTTIRSTYQWPKPKHIEYEDPHSPFTKANAQYGIMTKACDLPEGNILINKNAVKKLKNRTGTLSRTGSTLHDDGGSKAHKESMRLGK